MKFPFRKLRSVCLALLLAANFCLAQMNGAAAPLAENGEPFDVALLDFNMPGMDGFELARAIKSDARISAVRLVLMPSFGNRGDGRAARESGIAAYLTKPVKQLQLFDCLVIVLSADQIAAVISSAPPGNPVTRHSLAENKLAARVRILIAEDNAINQKVAKRQVENLGYRADIVDNGVEALAALEELERGVEFLGHSLTPAGK